MKPLKNALPFDLLLNKVQSLAGSRPVYLVGGFVRDLFAGIVSRDLDFVYLGNAEKYAKELSRELKGSFIVLDAVQGTYRIVLQNPGGPIILDISRCQGKTIEEDLARRDFTANAMAIKLQDIGLRTSDIVKQQGSSLLKNILRSSFIVLRSSLLDPYGGAKDFNKDIVKQVSSKIYKEDPLRILRAFRFMAQWDGTIENSTLATIRKHAKLAVKPSGERIREELLKLFSAPGSIKAIRLMDKAGVLTRLFPELEKSRTLALDYYPKIGVLGHILNGLERLEDIFREYPKRYPKIKKQLSEYFSQKIAGEYSRQALLKLAILLHDIGKPATAEVIEGRTRFFRHDELGQGLAENLLSKYRFSKREEATVSRLVRSHMRPGNLAHAQVITDKAIFRFFRDLGDDAVAMLIVSLADHQTYLKPGVRFSTKDPHVKLTKIMLERYFLDQDTVLPKKIVDGTLIMRELGIKPGPLVGEILKAVEEAQAEGAVKTQPEAIIFAKEYLRSHSH